MVSRGMLRSILMPEHTNTCIYTKTNRVLLICVPSFSATLSLSHAQHHTHSHTHRHTHSSINLVTAVIVRYVIDPGPVITNRRVSCCQHPLSSWEQSLRRK